MLPFDLHSKYWGFINMNTMDDSLLYQFLEVIAIFTQMNMNYLQVCLTFIIVLFFPFDQGEQVTQV